MNLVIVAWLFAAFTPVRRDAPTRQCPDSTTFFEFQVVAAGGKPARWMVDTALAVHPVPATGNPANLVPYSPSRTGVSSRRFATVATSGNSSRHRSAANGLRPGHRPSTEAARLVMVCGCAANSYMIPLHLSYCVRSQ